MIKFADPNIADLVSALSEAIVASRKIVPSEMHARIKTMYNWMNVCERTEVVYDKIAKSAVPTLGTRFLRYMTVGVWSGVATCFIVAAMHIMWLICCAIWPADDIDVCPDFPRLHQSRRRKRLSRDRPDEMKEYLDAEPIDMESEDDYLTATGDAEEEVGID